MNEDEAALWARVELIAAAVVQANERLDETRGWVRELAGDIIADDEAGHVRLRCRKHQHKAHR